MNHVERLAERNPLGRLFRVVDLAQRIARAVPRLQCKVVATPTHALVLCVALCAALAVSAMVVLNVGFSLSAVGVCARDPPGDSSCDDACVQERLMDIKACVTLWSLTLATFLTMCVCATCLLAAFLYLCTAVAVDIGAAYDPLGGPLHTHGTGLIKGREKENGNASYAEEALLEWGVPEADIAALATLGLYSVEDMQALDEDDLIGLNISTQGICAILEGCAGAPFHSRRKEKRDP